MNNRKASNVGLVLGGGGARGAYQVGALSVLLPVLEARGERPRIILGSSIGALNGALMAGNADAPVDVACARALDWWRVATYDDLVTSPTSLRQLGHTLGGIGELLGVPGTRIASLLDNGVQRRSISRAVDFEHIAQNVQSAALASFAVTTTSYATGETVVFHHSEPLTPDVPTDRKRAIRYCPVEMTVEHVVAATALPIVFGGVRLKPSTAEAGWYSDGGIRLNTPIKPALRLGSDRVVVIGLQSTTVRGHQASSKPDLYDGAAQVVQAILADQMAHDIATLAMVNELVADRELGPDPRRKPVPYIFVAPNDRHAVGRIAADVYERHFSGVRGWWRSPESAALGRAVHVPRGPARGDLLSYAFFAHEFIEELIELGQADAWRWLRLSHDDGPWRLGSPPV